jgi:hypothetical protein
MYRNPDRPSPVAFFEIPSVGVGELGVMGSILVWNTRVVNRKRRLMRIHEHKGGGGMPAQPSLRVARLFCTIDAFDRQRYLNRVVVI